MQNGALLLEAGFALGLQRGLAECIGVSTRTVQRWSAGQGSPNDAQWQTLARAAYTRHPELAARLAEQGRSSLDALGLAARPPTVAEPPAPPAYEAQHLADGVVCVAADAVDLTPRAIRPALLAAVRRARQMHLTLEDLESALGKSERHKTSAQGVSRGKLRPG